MPKSCFVENSSFHCRNKDVPICCTFFYFNSNVVNMIMKFIIIIFPAFLFLNEIYCTFFTIKILLSSPMNHIGGVMVSMLASGVVDPGFEPHSG